MPLHNAVKNILLSLKQLWWGSTSGGVLPRRAKRAGEPPVATHVLDGTARQEPRA